MLVLLSICSAGLCIILIIYVTLSPLGNAANHMDVSNNLEMSFLRLLLKLLKPWSQSISVIIEPIVSWHLRIKITQMLRGANLHNHCSATDWVGTSIILGVFSASFFTLILSLWLGFIASILCVLFINIALVKEGRNRRIRMLRELPFILDITTLCVEAGLNFQGALVQACEHGPDGPLKEELNHTLIDIRTGMSRSEALKGLAMRTQLDEISSLVNVVIQADKTGGALGNILRAQSEQRRSERFLRAEELAFKAPVKMLFPLVLFIFPCTFLILGFPLGYKIVNGVF